MLHLAIAHNSWDILQQFYFLLLRVKPLLMNVFASTIKACREYVRVQKIVASANLPGSIRVNMCRYQEPKLHEMTKFQKPNIVEEGDLGY